MRLLDGFMMADLGIELTMIIELEFFWGFPWGYPIVGWLSSEIHQKMNDDWGYRYDSGKLHLGRSGFLMVYV